MYSHIYAYMHMYVYMYIKLSEATVSFHLVDEAWQVTSHTHNPEPQPLNPKP